jgi:hypothetical protein
VSVELDDPELDDEEDEEVSEADEDSEELDELPSAMGLAFCEPSLSRFGPSSWFLVEALEE